MLLIASYIPDIFLDVIGEEAMLFLHQSLATLMVFLFSVHFALGSEKANENTKDEGNKLPISFELEFLARAELFKTANFLRTQGLNATVVEPKEAILIEAESYTKTLEKLTPLVPNLPDIARFVWKNGDQETVLYEAQEADLFVSDEDITDNRKVLQEWDDKARLTIVLKDDKSTIKYQSTVRKVEKMGYKVTFAEGYMDAGWMQFPAIDIEIPNNIASFRKAILDLSEISEVNRFLYNRGKNPSSNDYIITFLNESSLEKQISRLLANGIEVYKVDKLLNRLFIHFPQTEARNKIKVNQIKMLDGLVSIKNLHENQQLFTKEEYAKNLKHVWLDIPEEILTRHTDYTDYGRALNNLARKEVIRLKQKGMIIVYYGVYTEAGEVMIPELAFTHRDVDTPKAKDILKYYNTNASLTVAPKKQEVSEINICASLFEP